MINECIDDIRDLLEKHLTAIKDINPSHDIIDDIVDKKLQQMIADAISETKAFQDNLETILKRIAADIQAIYKHNATEIDKIISVQSELCDTVKSMKSLINDKDKKQQEAMDKITSLEGNLTEQLNSLKAQALIQAAKVVVLDFLNKPKTTYNLYSGH